jgi:hypothetical protein
LIYENNITDDIMDEVTVCQGEEYTWNQNGETYTAADSPVIITIEENGCNYTATLTINEYEATEDIMEEVTLCDVSEYTWNLNGETYTVADSPVVLSLNDDNGCAYTATLNILEENQIKIGDFVWIDANENGIQDPTELGINGVTVMLFHCGNNEMIDSTSTVNNPSNSEAGYYEFEVCANSGEYYIEFSNLPEDYEFTSNDSGDDTLDSDANSEGTTNCFEVEDTDVSTIDAGVFSICSLEVDAGETISICANDTTTLTANYDDEEGLCSSGCVYPILEQERCAGGDGTFTIYLNSTLSNSYYGFTASEQNFETFDNGTAIYTATATNGLDVIDVEFNYSGYATETPVGSPKLNLCQTYDTSDYEYYTVLNGTLTSQNHGVFDVTIMGAAFQIGMGADMVRLGFGASSWFELSGGDGTYTTGDINLALGECQSSGVDFQWTTEDGNIIGNPNQQTISISQAGTYTVQAVNCVDCEDSDTVVVTNDPSCSGENINPPSVAVYPVPTSSNSNVTIELDIEAPNGERKLSNLNVKLYDTRGRLVHSPRQFKVITGKNLLDYNMGAIEASTYIMIIATDDWSVTRRLIVN